MMQIETTPAATLTANHAKGISIHKAVVSLWLIQPAEISTGLPCVTSATIHKAANINIPTQTKKIITDCSMAAV